jgi:hypothetical protein
MATMIVRHKVADFGEWKKVFDSMRDVRKTYGWTHHEVLQDAADPNLVTIVNHMKSVEDGKSYGFSDALKEGMKKAGVISAPDITFLEDAEMYSYY